MLDTPHIVHAPARRAAVVRLRVSRAQLPQAIEAAIEEVRDALAAQDIVPGGAPFAHYLRMDTATLELDVGIPVDTPVTPRGRVMPGALPAARVARAVYQGAYDGLYTAWSEFGSWIHATGHAIARGQWEVYAVGPESNDDPAAWRTELNLPLASA